MLALTVTLAALIDLLLDVHELVGDEDESIEGGPTRSFTLFNELGTILIGTVVAHLDSA